MDFFRIIQNLRAEKKRLDKVIFALEELATGKAQPQPQEAPAPKKRRGRPPKQV